MTARIPRPVDAGGMCTTSSGRPGGNVAAAGAGIDGFPVGAPQLARAFQHFPIVAATAAITVGTLVLAGWVFEIGPLKSVMPGLATMKANTALAFILCGIALSLCTAGVDAPAPPPAASRLALWAYRSCAAAVTVIGLLTLLEYAFGWRLGIDGLLFASPREEPGVLHPGRMAPATAVSFGLLGMVFLGLDARTRRGSWPAQWLALAVAFGAFLALLGYAYGVQSLYRIEPYTSMALHTALLLLLLPIGLLCARPDRGLVGLVLRGDAAGAFVRRLLPATLVLPPLLVWLRLRAEEAGYFTLEFGEALVAAGSVAAFSGLVCWAARSVKAIESGRLRAAEALSASEARFRATIEAAPVGILMVDADGAIVLANTEAERLFGYPSGALAGGGIERLVPERLRDAHPSWRRRFAAVPSMRRMGPGRALSAVRRDGSEFPAEIGLSPVATARGTYVIATVVDITATQRTENELREHAARAATQAEALQRANKALERSNVALKEFAYIASHDLQTPLRSIAGFAQLLQTEYAGRLDGTADDWIRRMVESAKQMQALIQDVLEYSSLESSARPFERVSLRAVFDVVVSMLDASIRERGAGVTCGELPEVVGDRSQLVQLLQNLVSNALKYHGAAPSLVQVSAARSGDEWLIAVRDNGIGIDPQHHARIFDMFHRLHDGREYPGTGIGLAVCRAIVERHGGRIRVESAPGCGSIFSFTLPVRTETDT